MTEVANELCERARQLPPAQRLELVERILGSLDETDAALDGAWAQESTERLAAWRRGEIRALPLTEVLRSYRRA